MIPFRISGKRKGEFTVYKILITTVVIDRGGTGNAFPKGTSCCSIVVEFKTKSEACVALDTVNNQEFSNVHSQLAIPLFDKKGN